ncbi:sigma factor [Nesterenkonia marinintestina]|uniref:sigma factor n=1 Tax=Nesterenkonia marinintestina TaxID=2979865 RepID=UPI0021C2325E|nr:sigma factor [Nesterenkonia sp. GX14115]
MFTPEELQQAVATATVQVIAPRLAQPRLRAWREDVAQEVAIAVWEARDRFDPERGTLQRWVNAVAANKAVDMVRSLGREALLSDDGAEGRSPAEKLEAATAESPHQRVEVDRAVVLAEQLAIKEWLDPVMAVCEQVMEKSAYLHAYLTHYRWDGCVAEAARHMPTSDNQLREYKRQLELHVQVVDRAMRAARAGKPASFAVLRDCLPGEDTSGRWTRQVADALAAWPGRAEDMTVEYLAEATGWEINTARQRRPKVLQLLRVAATVITRYDELTGGKD